MHGTNGSNQPLNSQNKGPNSPYTGDYRRRNQIRGAYAWGLAPVRWALITMSAAPAAITPAVDCEKACQPLAPAVPSVGGYSLAIPISLITRSYFAS
jgi:hypothetical protein